MEKESKVKELRKKGISKREAHKGASVKIPEKRKETEEIKPKTITKEVFGKGVRKADSRAFKLPLF